jgi:hypothetical protein
MQEARTKMMGLPPAWPEVLGQVQAAVQQAKQAAAEREQALAGKIASEAPAGDAACQVCLQILRECLTGLEACAAKAAAIAALADEGIAADEKAVQSWLAGWRALGQQLADGGAGSVK